MPILTHCHHISHDFRVKCIFTDYDYNKPLLFFLYRYIYHVCEFWLIFVLLFMTRLQNAHHLFSLFYKSTTFLILWVHTNKRRPFWMITLTFYEQKLRHSYWKKMQKIDSISCGASPHKLLDIAHIYIGLMFKHCYNLELFYIYRCYFRQVVIKEG